MSGAGTMRTGLLALGALAGFCASTQALAQQAVPQIQGGQRQIDIRAVLEGIYSSNIAHTNLALANLRGIHPQDGIIHPSAAFEIIQPIGRQAVFLNGEAGYDFHTENKTLDRLNVNVTGGGLIVVGRCHSTLFGRYAATQSDLGDVASPTNATNQITTTAEGGSVGCGSSSGFNAQVQGVHDEATNSAALQSVADHQNDTISLSLGYANQRLGQLSLVGTYAQAEFPKRVDAAGHVGDSYWNQVLGVSYARQFGAKFHIQASAGQMSLHRNTAPAGIPKQQSNFNYSLAAAYQVNSRLAVTLTSTRAFLPSNSPGKLYDLTTAAQLMAAYQLGTRFQINAGGDFQDLKANQDTASPVPTLTKSQRWAAFGQFHYTISRRLTAGLDVRYEDRTADLAVFNYSDTRVSLTLSASL
jgi:hypothetical protein